MDHTVALQLLATRQPAFHFALLLLLVPANLSIPREPESLPRWQPGWVWLMGVNLGNELKLTYQVNGFHFQRYLFISF